MDISVGGVGLYRGLQPVEVTGRYVLRGGTGYTCGRKRAGHRPSAARGSRGSVSQIRAQEHNYAARHVMLAEMDMGLRDRDESGIGEHIFKSLSLLVQV